MGAWGVCGFMEGGRGGGEGRGRQELVRGGERLRSGIVVCVSVDVRRTELLVVVC